MKPKAQKQKGRALGKAAHAKARPLGMPPPHTDAAQGTTALGCRTALHRGHSCPIRQAGLRRGRACPLLQGREDGQQRKTQDITYAVFGLLNTRRTSEQPKDCSELCILGLGMQKIISSSPSPACHELSQGSGLLCSSLRLKENPCSPVELPGCGGRIWSRRLPKPCSEPSAFPASSAGSCQHLLEGSGAPRLRGSARVLPACCLRHHRGLCSHMQQAGAPCHVPYGCLLTRPR